MSEALVQDGSTWPVPKGIRDCDEQTKRKIFIDFVGKTNLLLDVSYQPVITQLILKELRARPGAVALDIGCGFGIGLRMEYTHVVSGEAGELWGVEPDETVKEPAGLFHHFQHALLEDARLPENHFDVAYAAFVMEHVQDPKGFLDEAYRVLKPGGSLLFITPNAAALFGRASRWLNRLKLDETVLRMLKGKSKTDEYHYPLASRCNTTREIYRFADAVGFNEPEIAFFQFDGGQSYFPGPLRVFYRALIAKRRLINNPGALDSIICRLTKPQ